MESDTPSRDTARAMSQENVEIVRRFFEATERAMSSYWRDPRSITEAYEADDLTAEGEEALSFFDPGIVWKAGGFGTFQGIKEMLATWDDIFEIADGYRTSVRELREGEGDLVYGAVDRTITAKGSGIEATVLVFVAIRLKNGRLAQVEEYLDRHEALKAAGLSD
jgi:ketosteroid isomerase-like protein